MIARESPTLPTNIFLRQIKTKDGRWGEEGRVRGGEGGGEERERENGMGGRGERERKGIFAQ